MIQAKQKYGLAFCMFNVLEAKIFQYDFQEGYNNHLLIVNIEQCSRHKRPYWSQFRALGWLLKYYACVKPAVL